MQYIFLACTAAIALRIIP